ncbi:hypothetical protein [Methanofollis sp. W23]|uniref:hypothetical protein n=1 Tax=Methanofollis sp. W23 TaxID=2817849 RepID=UPI001AEA8CAA|nr:hypothetical protein [Methanofollis sp. W23]
MGREFLLGAVFGEWGADEHDNIYYLGGWIASGVVVLGDVRDIAATISRGDLVGTGLNLAAVIPGYGDAAKVSAIVGKFVVVHPELLKPAMVLMVGVAPHVDEAAETINALRKAHGDDVIDRLLRDGITENELKVVVNSNGNLLRTLAVVKRGDGTVVWLEEGNNKWGWTHIKKKHITGEIRDGTLFPSSMTETDVKNLIFETLRNPCVSEISMKNSNLLHYHDMVPPNGKYIRVVTNPEGMIISAYMVNKLPSV